VGQGEEERRKFWDGTEQVGCGYRADLVVENCVRREPTFAS
jgi:hypothetical protein